MSVPGASGRRLLRIRTGMSFATAGRSVLGCSTLAPKYASSDASDRLTPVGTPLPSLDSMSWRLVQQISWTLGLVMDRAVSEHETTLTIEFPRTIHDEIEGVSVVEMDQGFGVSDNSPAVSLAIVAAAAVALSALTLKLLANGWKLRT